MVSYTGKVVIVTGASSGIGRALALALAGQRARLVLAARDPEACEAVAVACRGKGADVLVVPTDVSVIDACRALVDKTVERFKVIDALVNNAGLGMIGRFDEITDLGLFDRLMRVNYLGSVYPTHFALPHLKESHGQIVAVASLAGITGVPSRSGYAASKHAVFGFFESLRIELRGTGIAVTIVAPDFVVSEIHRRALGPDGKPTGESPIREADVMTSEECAALIVKAMAKRQRLLITSARGRFGRYLKLVAPGLIDRIARRAIERGR